MYRGKDKIEYAIYYATKAHKNLSTLGGRRIAKNSEVFLKEEKKN